VTTTATTRALLVGSVGAGKTTLANLLADRDRPADKTQQTEFVGAMIDTPGEYLDHPRLNHALLLASHEAELVLMLVDASDRTTRLPPGFASFFTTPVIGVVTKVDIADEHSIRAAENDLRLAGASRILRLSAASGDGICELRAVMEAAHDG